MQAMLPICRGFKRKVRTIYGQDIGFLTVNIQMEENESWEMLPHKGIHVFQQIGETLFVYAYVFITKITC